MSQDKSPNDNRPQYDNTLYKVVLDSEIRLAGRQTKVWEAADERHFGFRAALTQFGVRFEPVEVKAPPGSTLESDGVHPVTVPMARVVYLQHRPVPTGKR